MNRLRVAVATDRIGAHDSATAGAAIALGFAPVAQVAVVPIAAGGPDLARAFAALAGGTVTTPDAGAGPDAARTADAVPTGAASRWFVRAPGQVLIGLRQPAAPAWAPRAATADLGEWIAACLAADDTSRVVLDLTGVTAHDAGEGLLAAAASVLTGREVVGIVAHDELELPATGIGGGLARRAFAGRVDVAELLAADAELAVRARRAGPGLDTAPGGGAAGGAGLAILSLGGELLTGTQFCHRLARLDATLAAADLVVTGCTELSALDRGGPVVTAVAGWAEAAQRACVLFTTGAGLARRELRTLGIEAAHLLPPGEPTPAAITATAARIAAGWVPGSRSAQVDWPDSPE